MKIVRKLLLAVACVGMFHVGASFAADAPKAALAKNEAAKDLILKGDAKCTGCHDEADEPSGAATMLELNPGVLAIGKTKHGTRADSRTPTCVDCHGASEDHLNHKGSSKPPKVDISFRVGSTASAEKRSGACLTCHEKDSKRHLWAGSAHETNGVACNSCHKTHSAKDKVADKRTQPEVCFACHKEQRAQINKPSRHPIPEGKMGCSDCHNPHGSGGPKLMKRDSVVETCYTCHMEKRGPFVHTHEPVNEDCSHCHNPHGTVTESMLKARPPFLCHQCHTPHGGNIPALTGQTVPALTTATSSPLNGKSPILTTQGRGCLNCHTQVHGSNNPSTTNPTPQFNLR